MTTSVWARKSYFSAISGFLVIAYILPFRSEMPSEMPFRDHICHVCGSCFKTPGGLRKHIICHHERERLKFQCPDCYERFIDRRQMDAHKIAKHGSYSYYTCETCGKAFSQSQNLTRHQKHNCKATGTASFKCTLCTATFKRRDSLADHIQVKHIFRHHLKCDLCGLYFNYRGSLSKHKARKHKDV